jgi:tape measure domain-containing protein
MATIDDKVVAMSFESDKFESGVNNTLSALDKLKAALHFPNAGKGLDELNAAGKRVDLGHIAQGVDNVRSKLESLRLVAIGVMSQLATQAIRAGATFVKSFTIDPIKQGFAEYATNLNAIQTILANTQASGATLKDVNAALLDLNKYSDKTIYNFSEMARNIGTFTAAGVDLKTSTEAIKGIANLAALSGSNSQQASTAMYQLSQAIAAGQVHLQDWNSVVNAGMGGTVFQRALAQTAVSMGKLKDGSLKLVGPMKNVSINGESFRQSMQAVKGKSWLTSEVLTNTLKQFTGDLSNAELKAQGFNDAQIKSIQATAKTAQAAATQVKTLGQVFDVAKETAGSGWAQTFQIIFGDFGEAKQTFTALSNAINGFINTNAQARNKVLADWKALGGRTVLIDGIKTAFHNLGLVIAPIKDAFREIFPATTGKNLFDLTVGFKNFADALKPSQSTIDGLKRTFAGLFAILDIGKQIVGGIFTVFGQLFGAVSKGRGSFLDFTGGIGDFLVSVDQALKKGDRLHNFFLTIGNVLKAPIDLITALGHALSDLFSGFSPGGFFGQMSGMSQALTPFQRVVEVVSTAWHNFLDTISNSGNVLKPAVDAIVSAVSQLGPALGQAFGNINFEAVFAAIRTGLFAGLLVMMKQFLGQGSFVKQITQGFSGGLFSNFTKSFGSLQGTMVSLQNNIKAKTLKEIAIAIALLTASVVALSFVNADRLKSSVTAMGFMFAELLGAMAILDKIGNAAGFIKLPFIASTLVILAGAIDLLTIAVFALSRLSWEQLLKGLGGVGFLLAAISVAAVPLSANAAGMIRAGIGVTAIAVALNILALAVRQFGAMNWTQLGKGLVGISGGLAAIAAAVTFMPKSMALQGAGLILFATGLKILASAVGQFATMKWQQMGRGLAGLAGSLLIIAGAMQLMPLSLPVTGAGLILVAFALGKIADAVAQMGGMSVMQIAKGLGTLAASLLILAVALNAMSGAIGGAVALGVAAAGMALLAPALVLMGRQSWGEILKGLVTLAGALTILGIAGVALTPTIPSLLGLGAALVLIGGGLALAGAGIALIGVGLSAIAVAGPAAIGILVGALTTLAEEIPKFAKNVVLGLLEMVKALSDTAPQFVDALAKILNTLIDVIIKESPKIALAFNALLNAALQVLAQNQGKVIQAGFDLLVALLKGIRNNIPQLVTLVIDIVNRFLSTIADNLGKIATAGLNILAQLIKGILSGITGIVTTVVTIITRFVGAIADNLVKIATAGLSILNRLLKAIADNIGSVIKSGTDIIVAFVEGIGNAGQRVIAAGVEAITKFINAIVKGSLKLVNAGAEAIVNFLNGVANAINAHAGEMQLAGARVGIAIVNGMTFGLLSKAQGLYNEVSNIMSHAMSLMHTIPGIHSPSTVTYDIGGNIIKGLVRGLDRNAVDAYSSAEAVANGVINAVKSTLQIESPSKVMIQIGQYVTQGFAEGIRGSSSDIKSAFDDLNNKLTDSMAAARETIAKEQDKLDKLREAKKPDAAAIREAQKVIAENQDLLARSTAGHTALVSTLKDEKNELMGLTNDYEKVSEKLKAANQVLDDARKTRNDAIKSFTEQYATLPSIVKEDAEGHAVDQLATYMDALKNQGLAVSAYRATLDQLRKLGLDDATYQKLLSEGTEDQRFATQLLSGGKDAVLSLNKLDANLQYASKQLGTHAGDNLYQAGVDAAAGLVKGLQSKLSDLHKTMVAIAREILTTLKQELKIKSPSQEFAEIGRYSMEGMAKGFTDSSQVVTDAVENAAKDALDSMRSSMHGIATAVANEMNLDPVITPVLDLTQVRSQVAELTALTSSNPINAATSLGQASIISSEQTAAQAAQTDATLVGPSVKFEQNNYSPDALSEVEIYRNTKNQLSQLKSVLAIT